VNILRARGLALAIATLATGSAQVPEPELPRPGAIVISDLSGTATAITGEQRKALKVDERLRIGATVVTNRRSLVTLLFSNGASVQLGSESELEVEEFGQAPVSGSLKYAELKEEPTISRTRLRLVQGDARVTVKPLKATRGSSFTVSLLAGTLRLRDGSAHVMVRMSDLGLGVCNLELLGGAAEFEPAGGKFLSLPAGRKLAFAIEQDKRTGAIKVGEMPKELPPAKK
jgi:hypothetical protein